MKLRASEIRNMSPLEREKKLADLKAEHFKINSTSAMGGTLPDPTRIRQLKRAIARIKTIQHENNEI
ncbi:MAG: 50S ribosomal protein L29 [Promethearchaeota archaeon]